ncbi:hypothetical protein QJS10_CPA07g00553 [Acorus calamus]|uniref:Uncharacterized protein n=1 Tax=Acorus calamus TaxID=4465 RepID=A0AAV9EI95_ACOCL|nr:hypothetical protein QJS10_CPA07g00553 [Acorus calamus]
MGGSRVLGDGSTVNHISSAICRSYVAPLEESIQGCQFVLKWFEWIVGLKLDIKKCGLVLINISPHEADVLSDIFGYPLVHLPCKSDSRGNIERLIMEE